MARILFLEPFGGGSHQSLYRGWGKYTRHDIDVLELPAVHWKWRSRHASLTLAQMANQMVGTGVVYDTVVASSMLNLPEWLGLVDPVFRQTPCVVYFHENQLTYPLSPGQTRDYHYAYSSMLSAISAEQCWFNSSFHKEEFEKAAVTWLRRMPDYPHLEEFEHAMQRSIVLSPGIDPPKRREFLLAARQTSTEPVIGWVARWEHDKQPEVFVEVVGRLLEEFEFKLVLLGQTFTTEPDCLADLRNRAGNRILHAGYAPSQEEYWSWLTRIDLVVSTAVHEFFGIGILEAMHAGSRPLLPNRLAYPELLRRCKSSSSIRLTYDSDEQLYECLSEYLTDCQAGSVEMNLASNMESQPDAVKFAPNQLHTDQFCWDRLATRYDNEITAIIQKAT